MALLLSILGARAAAEEAAPARQFAGLWTVGSRITAQAQQMLLVLAHADELGLRPADYGAEPLAAAQVQLASGLGSSEAVAAFDVQLTRGVLRYIHDAHFGRIDPRQVGFELDAQRKPFDSQAMLLNLAHTDSVRETAASFEPQFYHYALLKAALFQYRALARNPPPILSVRPTQPIKVGDSYAQAPALREFLIRLGDLPLSSRTTAGPLTIDTPLEKGILHFQARHGLKADGALNLATFRALTVPLEARVHQIELTLERWRWVPEFAAPPIIVNIPQFRLFAFRTLNDRKSEVLQMDVIVGRTFRAAHTPIFMAAMTSVIFRPYWQIPGGIVREEMLPKLVRQPNYLSAQHLEIVANSDEVSPPLPLSSETLGALRAGRLHLRQRPGPDNALGLVKFSLPNPHDIYLHSTPAPALFKESVRAFSHGCIRVSDPVALAVHVLRDTPGPWSAESVREAMLGNATRHVALAHPIPVLILYGTAFATEDGKIFFYDDLYGHDQKLAAALLGL
jgi:murein L,D-transpeptidase YcbB/YkuD